MITITVIKMILLTFLVANLVATIKKDEDNAHAFFLIMSIVLSGGICIYGLAVHSLEDIFLYAMVCCSSAIQYDLTFK